MTEPTEVWVDPRTGEVVPEGTKGAVLVEARDWAVEAADRPQYGDDSWLPDYYTERLAEWSAKEALLERQHQRRLAQLRADRAGFERYFRARVERVVAVEAQQQRRRSVDYAYGRLGFRRSRARWEVEDEKRALEWAREHAPLAIKVEVSERLLKTELPQKPDPKQPIPGLRWLDPEERFYAEVRA